MRCRPLPLIALLGVWALVLGLGVAAPAGAQTVPDRIETALERTDQALDSAQELVRETDSRRARELLETAQKLQLQAWEKFHEGRLSLATALTAEARGIASRAVTMAREDASLRERARREGEKAMRALQYAKEQLGQGSDSRAGQILDQAAEMIERGRVKFHEQHYEVALRLALSAQRLVRQAAGITSGTDQSRVRRELERTDNLIERVTPAVMDSEASEAARLLAQGKELQGNAWRSFRDGRPRVALALTREARGLVNRARLLAQGPDNHDSVDRALDETDRLLGRAAHVVKESGDERSRALLERANVHQMKARRLLADGQLRKALAETRVARALAKRAMRPHENGVVE